MISLVADVINPPELNTLYVNVYLPANDVLTSPVTSTLLVKLPSVAQLAVYPGSTYV